MINLKKEGKKIKLVSYVDIPTKSERDSKAFPYAASNLSFDSEGVMKSEK